LLGVLKSIKSNKGKGMNTKKEMKMRQRMNEMKLQNRAKRTKKKSKQL